MLQLLVVEIGFQTLPGKGRTRPVVEVGVLRELCVYDIRILVPIINTNPHLHIKDQQAFLITHLLRQGASTYLSERAEPCQDTASDPCRVLALWWRKDLDTHILDC